MRQPATPKKQKRTKQVTRKKKKWRLKQADAGRHKKSKEH